MADLTREQIEQVYSNFEKVIDCSPVHEGKAEARKCLRMVTDLALSALDAQGEPVAWKKVSRAGIVKYLDYDPTPYPEDMIGDCTLTPLYTRPSPAAVQALREAREELAQLRAEIPNIQSIAFEDGLRSGQKGVHVIHLGEAEYPQFMIDSDKLKVCHFHRDGEDGDPSVGMPGWSGWILDADQDGTILGDLIAEKQAK